MITLEKIASNKVITEPKPKSLLRDIGEGALIGSGVGATIGALYGLSDKLTTGRFNKRYIVPAATVAGLSGAVSGMHANIIGKIDRYIDKHIQKKEKSN